MKTILSFAAFAAIIFLTACGSNDSDASSKTTVDVSVLADNYCKCLEGSKPDTCTAMFSRHYDLLIDDVDAYQKYASIIEPCNKAFEATSSGTEK